MDQHSCEYLDLSTEDIDGEIQKHRDAIIRLQRQRNAKTLISRLPPEILSHIFLFNVLDDNSTFSYALVRKTLSSSNSWTNFTRICHHWREVALNTPTLWSFWGSIRASWIETFTARSKAAPLHIRLSYLYQASELKPIFFDRDIAELHVKADSSEIASFLQHFDDHTSTFPCRLSSLRLSGFDRYGYKPISLPNLFTTCEFPRLWQLELAGFDFSLSLPILTSSTLTHLVLNLSCCTTPPTTSQLLSFLEHQLALQELTLQLDNSKVVDPGDVSADVYLSHLRQLKLIGRLCGSYRLEKHIRYDRNSCTVVTEVSSWDDPKTDLDAYVLPFLASRYVSSQGSKTPVIRCLSLHRLNLGFNLSFWHDIPPRETFGDTTKNPDTQIQLKWQNSFMMRDLVALDPVLKLMPLGHLFRLEISGVELATSDWSFAFGFMKELEELDVTGDAIITAIKTLELRENEKGKGKNAKKSGKRRRQKNKGGPPEQKQQPLVFPKLRTVHARELNFDQDGLDTFKPDLFLWLQARKDVDAGLHMLTVERCRNFDWDDVALFEDVVATVLWDEDDMYDEDYDSEEDYDEDGYDSRYYDDDDGYYGGMTVYYCK